MEYIGIGLFFVILFVFSYYFRLSYIFPTIILSIISGFFYLILSKQNLEISDLTNSLSFFYDNVFIFLFFTLGLGYNFRKIYQILLRSIVPSLLDLLNFFLPWVVFYLFLKDFLVSFILALILYPSSTSIIVKKLENYKLLFSKQADFLLGVLLFEDLILIILLSFISLKKFYFSMFFIGVILFAGFIYILNRLCDKYKKELDLIMDSDLGIFLVIGVLLFFVWLFYYVFYIPYFISSFVLGLSINEYVANRVRLRIDVFKDLSLASYMFVFFFTSIVNYKGIGKLVDVHVLLVFVILLFFKFITTYFGGRIFGISKKRLSFVSLLSMIRGEFSIVAVSFIPNYFLLALISVVLTNLLFSFGSIYFKSKS